MNDSKIRRLIPIDSLRGLIMILMALDHANYFVANKHPPGEHWGGNFPAYQNGIAFITRLVTHLSAPGFFFLMGVGMYFFARARREQGWTSWAIIRHFVIRGLLLMALQFIIINPIWKLGPAAFPETYIGVLFALGGTMIIASLLMNLKPLHWLLLAGALFLGTEMLHPDPSQWGLSNPWGLITLYSGGSLDFWSNYPILPWLELVVLGLFFGNWIKEDSGAAYKGAFWVGAAFLAAFTVLRSLNGFSNIRPIAGDSWIDFFNVVKYPPSMVFSLMTLGVNLIILAGISRVAERYPRVLSPLAVYGRVPLFFYVTHLLLYLGLGVWFTPKGTSILAMYPYWLLGLVVLYPFCTGWGKIKRSHPTNPITRYL